MPKGLILAAPKTDSGKTLVSFALLSALSDQLKVQPYKMGPDYIDPGFHSFACARPSFNLDPWAMSPQAIKGLVQSSFGDADIGWVEGAMGLFDAALDGQGSTADLTEILDWPMLLLVDCKGLGQSVAPWVKGFADYRPGLRPAGLILNRVASQSHALLLKQALKDLGIPLLGFLPPCPELSLEHRHLGLVGAGELGQMEALKSKAKAWLREHLDWEALVRLAAGRPEKLSQSLSQDLPKPPFFAPKIAWAADKAFPFCYAHWKLAWQKAGGQLYPFSPLEDQAPYPQADAIFLPGGYPELFAEQLSQAQNLHQGLKEAHAKGKLIYGECGGFMLLGRRLIDSEGQSWPMLGLLPHSTSFLHKKRHLGYRLVNNLGSPLSFQQARGHEFHYTSERESEAQEEKTALFSQANALKKPLRDTGYRRGNTMGSYLHLIAC